MLTPHPQTAVYPIRNGCRLLDICTGLGYTAVGAAELGAVVTTVELDDAMQARAVLFSARRRQMIALCTDW